MLLSPRALPSADSRFFLDRTVGPRPAPPPLDGLAASAFAVVVSEPAFAPAQHPYEAEKASADSAEQIDGGVTRVDKYGGCRVRVH